MDETFGATFSSPDLVTLTRALIDAAPYARGMPVEMDLDLVNIPISPDWRERLLAPDVDGLAVRWGQRQSIKRNAGAIAADFPAISIDATQVLEFVAQLPFELAVAPPVHDWMDDYFAPAIGATHALLGWCAVFKGAGHEQQAAHEWMLKGSCDSIIASLTTSVASTLKRMDFLG